MDIATLFSIRDRVAVVTGGSAGIGRHIATGLAAAGAKVYICARTEAKVQAAAEEMAQRAQADQREAELAAQRANEVDPDVDTEDVGGDDVDDEERARS